MIRKYQPQDLEHIMKIWLETNLAAHGFIPAEYWNEQYEAVKEALPQADILIYEEEGTVLGFLGLQDSYIAGLFVEKASQSRGIGRLLLEAAKSVSYTHLIVGFDWWNLGTSDLCICCGCADLCITEQWGRRR